MNRDLLAQALEGIRDEYIAEAASFGLPGKETEMKTKKIRPRKLWRTLLIAAVLASLFTVTAYAAGVFGLQQQRYTVAPEGEERSFLSMNGVAGSPEFQANQEWFAYRRGWNGAVEEDWYAMEDEDTVRICQYYGCYSREMADKLFAIAEKYGLGLHTRAASPFNLKQFCQIAGAGDFLSEDTTGGGYIYENGAFKLEALRQDGDKLYSILCVKSVAGVITPFDLPVEEPERYTEWSYKTASGDAVSLDWQEESGELLIFYQEGDAFLLVCCDGVEDAQRAAWIADGIDFHKAAVAKPDFSVLDRKPSAAKHPGEALSVRDFQATDELRAACAFLRYENARTGMSFSNWYYSVPGPVPEVDEQISAIAAEYGLTAAKDMYFIGSWQPEEMEKWTKIMSREDFIALGVCGDVMHDDYYAVNAYFDNGVFVFLESEYIPKGALSTALEYELDRAEYATEWFYQTACGEIVAIATDASERTAPSLILYESAEGYVIMTYGNPSLEPYRLEAMADEVDFTQFR